MKAGGPDLRRLRYFVAVCDHGGFSRAASAIGVAQPALTRQIQLLEEEVGQPLVERSGRGATPSVAGRFLLERARGPLQALDDALGALRAAFGDAAAELTLGVCPSIAPFFLDDLLAHFARRHPRVSLHVIEAYSGDLRSLMAAGRVDAALTYSGAAPPGFTNVDLITEPLALVGGPGALAPVRATLAQAAQARLILPSRIHELRALIDRAAARRGVALKADIELDSLDAVKSLIAEPSSRRLTILPLRSVRAEVAAGALCASAFAEPDMRRTIALSTPAAPGDSRALALVAAWIEARAGALSHTGGFS